MIKGIFLACSLFFAPYFSKADELISDTLKQDSVIFFSSELNSHDLTSHIPNWKFRLVERIKKNVGENNRVVAAILAFPIFGITGLHRIYLGTKPYVPVVYIASLGGCAGILPLIDFFAIIFSDQEAFDCYKENPKVFMWIK